jgi:DNA-binding CsgD family transcriptional regulator
MGRPKKDIDEKQVAKLAKEGASNRDIAALLDCTEDTIRKRFLAILTKGRAERRMEIRRKQTASMRKGNIAMLIWLGKQELDQADRSAVTVGTNPEQETKSDPIEEIARQGRTKK